MTQHPEMTRDEVDRLVDEFFEWAGDALPYRVAFKREDGQWFALAVDYDITGRGQTLREAFDELLELVAVYLIAYYREGSSPVDAVRRVPLALRAKIHATSAVARVAHAVSRRPQLAGQSNLATPSSAIEHALVC